ncbi:MAG: response regulator [Rhodocyclales bacterium]|nr:response regulator [Rhodocyclales bacterium]
MSDALVQAASPRRLLVVDDNPVNRKLAVAFVQRLGWQVEQAEAGAEALRLLAERPFDMVLLDISMPQMSGEEVLAHIRQTPALAGLRVVAYTAHALPEEKQTLMALGFDDLLIKPVSLKSIEAVLLP